jgi:hypothetical protein
LRVYIKVFPLSNLIVKVAHMTRGQGKELEKEVHKADRHGLMDIELVVVEEDDEVSIAIVKGTYEERKALRVVNAIIQAIREEKEKSMKGFFVLFFHLIVCDCEGIDNSIKTIEVEKQ